MLTAPFLRRPPSPQPSPLWDVWFLSVDTDRKEQKKESLSVDFPHFRYGINAFARQLLLTALGGRSFASKDGEFASRPRPTRLCMIALSQRLPLGWGRARRGKDAENVDGLIHRHSEPLPFLVAFFGYEKQKNRNTSRSRANKTMLEDRCRYWDRHCLSLLTESNRKKSHSKTSVSPDAMR